MNAGRLPEGWVACSIADVAEVNPKKIDEDSNSCAGFVPMVHAPTDFNGDLKFDEKVWGDIKKSYTNFKDNDVIFAKVTPCFENGKAAIVRGLPNGIGAGSTEFYVLRPSFRGVLTEYLFGIIKTQQFMQNGAENMTGAVGLRRVPRAFVEGFPIALPPIAEQKAIAQKLDTLLAQVETTKARLDRIPAILKRFRQSVLAAAVSGKLTEEWRKVNLNHANLLTNIQRAKNEWVVENGDHNEVKRVQKRTSEFSGSVEYPEDLPEGWIWSQLEDCVLMIVDCHNKTAPYVDSGIPLIRTTNVRDGDFLWNKLNYVNQDTYEYWSKRCPPEGGDIIFTREAPMGEAAIIPAGEKYCLGQRTMLIRPVEGLVPSSYILLALMDPLFKKRAEEFAVGTGVKHFRVGDVSQLLIALPSTEEQTQIVKQVEALFTHADAIEKQVQAAQTRVNSLTQSILTKAFRGELTAEWRAANQDLISGDNSAEALLEKIKTEREAVMPKRKTRKKA